MGIAPQEEMPHPPLSAFDGRPHSFFLARWLPIIRAHFAPGNRATRTRSGRDHGREGSDRQPA